MKYLPPIGSQLKPINGLDGLALSLSAITRKPGGKAKTLSHNFIQAPKTYSSLGGALCHQTPSIKQTTYEVGVLVEHTW